MVSYSIAIGTLVLFTHICWSFKLSDAPINMSNSSNATVNAKVEDMIAESFQRDMKDIKSIPEPKVTGGDDGAGELGKSLEFLMLKVAQLETLAELQQVEIASLQKTVKEHLGVDKPSMVQLHEAQVIVKRVVEKHQRQRATREFHSAKDLVSSADKAEKAEKADKAEKAALLQRQRVGGEERSDLSSLDHSVAGKVIDTFTGPFVDAAGHITDGTGLVGDALGDAYEHAADKVDFVANTAINTVEMAVEILLRGFSDWSGRCDVTEPTVGISSEALEVNFGRQRCTVSLMGQEAQLFDFNFGTHRGAFPSPLRAVIAMGSELQNCAHADSPLEVIKCLGLKIIEWVPPLSYLNHMQDMLSEFLQDFSHIASGLVRQSLNQGVSLVQKASESKFGSTDSPPVVHHQGENLIITSHTQRAKNPPKLDRARTSMSALQAGPAENPSGAVAFSFGAESGTEATKLMTQFGGREMDTSSCLAFAPRNRTGHNGQATQQNWQVSNEDDFLALEPYAVPCGNNWMKDHWDRWQGFSFYSSPLPIDKCITVTFQWGMQPVVGVVGGLSFEVLPKPLAKVDTTVCWPNQRPGGLDLSVLRSEISTGSVLLYSRTVRLVKRFGGYAPWDHNSLRTGVQTWRSPAGLAKGESGHAFDTMRRTSFLETNRSEESEETEAEGEFEWQTDVEDLYLASVDYGHRFAANKTSELRGKAAARRLSETATKADSATELFGFSKQGMMNLQVKGLLDGTSLELDIQMGLGPFQSPARRIPLLDLRQQLEAALQGLPFISQSSRDKALGTLNHFAVVDTRSFEGLRLKPGSTVALHSTVHNRFVVMNDHKMFGGIHRNPDPFRPSMTWERFTVVDAGNGQIALHSARWNRFARTGGGVSPLQAASRLPPAHAWGGERFTVVVDAARSQIALHSNNAFLQMTPDGNIQNTEHMNIHDLPDSNTWERFGVLQVEAYLEPGDTVALHNAVHNRFLRMNANGIMDRSDVLNWNALNGGYTSERFTVVDAQDGQVALHSAVHNRFVKMDGGHMSGSAHKAADALPPKSESTSERFAVVPAMHGDENVIALHSTIHNRFISMTPNGVTAYVVNAHELPDGATWERFRVVKL
ncbi:unnamed protein product [Effrenium voratum]|nr:unnamed protein product [Effrenium voratum]